MCGICGFNFEDKSLLHRMCDLIKHRGPDDEGYFTDTDVSIGMRRLSIIDLITGQQPQHNENEDIWIVSNGEIFNYKKLKNDLKNRGHKFYTESDIEVIVHAYEEWGVSSVRKLRGQFAFCIYDSRKRILFLARDHMGLQPLYYYFDGYKFIFGSEIKCILCHNIKRELDISAFNFYLSLRFVPTNQTLFKQIHKIPPSSYLILDLKEKHISIKKYWDINFTINNNKSLDTLAEELKKLLEESVKIRLISDVPIGAFLSGGIDSSAIVGIMSKYMDKPVKTFSIGFEEGAPINETKYSRFVAEYYNTDHTEIIVKYHIQDILPKLIWHLDDLIGDAAIVPVYLMAKYAREKMTVSLTGDGADEVFGGYFSFYDKHMPNFIKNIPSPIFNLMSKFNKHIPNYKIRHYLSYIDHFKSKEGEYLRAILSIPDEHQSLVFPFKTNSIESFVKNTFLKDLDTINQFIRWDLKSQLPNLYNMKLDKMSMAASLEARVPYLDKKLVSWAATIPSKYKFYRNIEKFILRKAMKDILPPEILIRKKTAFGTPIGLWLNKGLKDVSNILLERLEKRINLINPSYIKKFKREHYSYLYEGMTWNLLVFELWYETFIENDGMRPINF